MSREELTNALRSCDFADDEIVEEMIDDMDDNGDGEISFEEFLATAVKAGDDERRGVAANLPLLMTAYSTRRSEAHPLRGGDRLRVRFRARARARARVRVKVNHG